MLRFSLLCVNVRRCQINREEGVAVLFGPSVFLRALKYAQIYIAETFSKAE